MVQNKSKVLELLCISCNSYIPVKIFLMVKGLSPRGESLPPSKLNPRPVPSFFRTTVFGGPLGTSTNFKSKQKRNICL